MRPATLCLLVRGDPPQVLLGLKKRGFGAGKWSGFGGKTEPGETPVRAAIRELREESGVIAAENAISYVAKLFFEFPSRPKWSQLVHVFVCHRWDGGLVETSEMIPSWFERSKIPFDEMWDDGVYWLPRILDGKRIWASFIFDADNERVVRMEERPLAELKPEWIGRQDQARTSVGTDE